MQLSLAFVDPPDPPPANSPPTPWERLDEAARMAALEVLARLIARMVAAQQARETSDE
jgi:hypothetical protein